MQKKGGIQAGGSSWVTATRSNHISSTRPGVPRTTEHQNRTCEASRWKAAPLTTANCVVAVASPAQHHLKKTCPGTNWRFGGMDASTGRASMAEIAWCSLPDEMKALQPFSLMSGFGGARSTSRTKDWQLEQRNEDFATRDRLDTADDYSKLSCYKWGYTAKKWSQSAELKSCADFFLFFKVQVQFSSFRADQSKHQLLPRKGLRNTNFVLWILKGCCTHLSGTFT